MGLGNLNRQMMGGLQRAPENSIVLQSFLELLSLLQLLQKLWVLWSSLEISGDHPGFADATLLLDLLVLVCIYILSSQSTVLPSAFIFLLLFALRSVTVLLR